MDQTVSLDVMLVGMALLACKHFVADYLLQPDWIRRDKGRYGGRGGVVHAAAHGALSVPACLVLGLDAAPAFLLCAAEAVLHYHIDFAKARISARLGDGPERWRFWAFFGFDQLLHQLTNIAMLAVAIWWLRGGG